MDIQGQGGRHIVTAPQEEEETSAKRFWVELLTFINSQLHGPPCLLQAFMLAQAWVNMKQHYGRKEEKRKTPKGPVELYCCFLVYLNKVELEQHLLDKITETARLHNLHCNHVR